MKNSVQSKVCCAFLGFTLLLCSVLWGCKESGDPVALEEPFLSVIQSQVSFRSEAGENILLKDYVYGHAETTTYYAKPQAYTLVDLDGDGDCEMIVDITPNQVYYMVFRKSGDTIYGFLLARRALQSLREDGSFMQSGGAQTNRICKMNFEGDTYNIEEVNDSIENWQLKKDAVWHSAFASAT